MTPEMEAKIVKAVSLGLWPDRAAEMHGIKPASMRSHRKRNPQFATALKVAEATAEAGIHGKILRHMDKQWTACAWMLERRWAERWGKKEPEVEVNVKNATTNNITPPGPPVPPLASFGAYVKSLSDAAAGLGLTVAGPTAAGDAPPASDVTS